MVEHDALIGQYSHLNKLPREKEALHSLQKIASLVKPIMRARNWTVGTLAEFWPDQQNLLGINMNKGQKICLRLRYPGDQNQFLPLEQVVDTMLHELSHNVHGPHNAEFHALWDQLRKEYEGLVSKGYTGEGFLSEGHRLGGRGVPRDEARRIARVAAEKRRTLYAGSGQKLGGRPVAAGTDIRRVIVDAIERRNTVLKGCGSGNKDEKEIKDLADQATQSGFNTKAEEDEANDRAIAQALWELVQEDEKKEYGDSYIPPTASNPTGNGGGEVGPDKLIKKEAPPPVPLATKPKSKAPPIRQHSDRPVSRLVAENTPKRPKTIPSRSVPSSSTQTASAPPPVRAQIPAPDPPSPPPYASGWTCPVCTLHNPIHFLACDACTLERPAEITKQIAEADRKSVTTSQPTASKLRALLSKENEIIVCPGVYDGFTARLALNAGFKILYMTGAGTTMSRLGMADLGVATMNDMRDHAAMIASIDRTIPLVADADTGYGGPLMVGRTTAAYISAGVAGFHLEDQVVNKRCGHLKNKELVDEPSFVSRILAASTMRSQLGRDIVIIARTDALASLGYDVALMRLKKAVEAGADVAFLEGVTSHEKAKRFCADMKGVPCLFNCVPGGVSPVLNVKEARECGYRMIITPTIALGAVFEAVNKAYKGLMEEGDSKGNGVAVRDLFKSCGLNDAVEFDVKAGGKLYQNGV